MGFCGVVIALIPVFKGFNSLALLSGLFGMFIAANYSLTSIILVELITIEKFTSAYGLLLLVQGIANLVGPPLAGKLFQRFLQHFCEKFLLFFYRLGV
jgi:MFS transporter, MCT family, solute carrier family 16 (monocarboxylic acid transporters), member 9